jgi:hypothetical protein
MNRFVFSGLAFAMALGTAQAEPLTLSAEQMDQVTASGNGRVWLSNNQVTGNATNQKFQDVFVFGRRPSESGATNARLVGFGTLSVAERGGRGGDAEGAG